MRHQVAIRLEGTWKWGRYRAVCDSCHWRAPKVHKRAPQAQVDAITHQGGDARSALVPPTPAPPEPWETSEMFPGVR